MIYLKQMNNLNLIILNLNLIQHKEIKFNLKMRLFKNIHNLINKMKLDKKNIKINNHNLQK